MSKPPKTGIARSLDVYYRDTARTARMDRLHASLVQQGALVFDIGAHVGDRTDSFARLGAEVVSVEPQPRVFRALRLIHHGRPNITLRNMAVGATTGAIDMFINSDNPTISTASGDLIKAAADAREWQGQTWDSKSRVSMTTLDALVGEFGTPDFVKIDVEGFEHEVLKGLSTPLPLVSFEFTTIQKDVAFECIDRMASLGPYRFNYSLGETHSLIKPATVTAHEIRAEIRDLPASANSGDIFAWLEP